MTPTTDLQKLLAEATKGPWMALGTDPAEGVDCFWIAAFMRGFTKEIGSVNGSQNDPTQQANARLIAMAPDLAARVIELEAENKRLREGLFWIADIGFVQEKHAKQHADDCCKLARETLGYQEQARTDLKGGE